MKHKIGILMLTITVLLIVFTMAVAAVVEPEPTVDGPYERPLVCGESCNPTYQLPSNPNCNGLTGDLNKDGIIDELDFEVIKQIIIGQEEQTPCADLDNDGIVSPSDLSNLKVTVIMDIPRNNITFEPSASLLANTECKVFGDVNGDGKANYQDVGIIKKMIVGQYPSSKCADLDGDTIVSPGDMSIAKIIEQGLALSCFVTHNCTVENDTNANQTENTTNENETIEPVYVYHLPSNPNCNGLTGDLNGDGLINDYDIEIVKQMVIGQEAPSPCADLDGDGIVSPSDVSDTIVTIIEIYTNNITLEPKNLMESIDIDVDCITYGDPNNDGKVDYKDVGLIKEMIVGTIPNAETADLDGDGVVSPSDVSIAQQMAFGLYVDTTGMENKRNSKSQFKVCGWNPGNETNNTDENETGDDQGDDNDNQGNETDNNQTNSTGNNSTNSTGNTGSTSHRSRDSSGGSHSSGSSGSVVMSPGSYPIFTDEDLEPPKEVVVVETSEQDEIEDMNFTAVEITSEMENTFNPPSMLMSFLLAALTIASMGTTSAYIRKRLVAF